MGSPHSREHTHSQWKCCCQSLTSAHTYKHTHTCTHAGCQTECVGFLRYGWVFTLMVQRPAFGTFLNLRLSEKESENETGERSTTKARRKRYPDQLIRLLSVITPAHPNFISWRISRPETDPCDDFSRRTQPQNHISITVSKASIPPNKTHPVRNHVTSAEILLYSPTCHFMVFQDANQPRSDIND